MGSPIDQATEGVREETARRLELAAEHVRTSLQVYRAAVEARNALIFEAIDERGLSHRETARFAGLTPQRIEAVLAGW